jgi:NurA-like 5'-3' nuclease
VGRSNNPYLSRVEIPRWVAENEHLLNLLHASLLTQARVLGARPYPYILHRAHEVAVISYDERQQLENMIIAELYRKQGVEVEDRI